MIREVLRMGDARLLQAARPVTACGTPQLRALIADMRDTMDHLDGVDLRVVIFGIESNPRYPQAEAVPFTVLINPVVTPLTADEEDGWEGCLSVPGLRGLVPRIKHVRYQGLDEQGQVIEREVAGFHARVVQHECDHLDGILYPMRVKDLRHFGFHDVLFPGGNAPVSE